MTPEEIKEIMNYTRDPILDSFVDKLNVKDKEYKKELYSMIYNYINTSPPLSSPLSLSPSSPSPLSPPPSSHPSPPPPLSPPSSLPVEYILSLSKEALVNVNEYQEEISIWKEWRHTKEKLNDISREYEKALAEASAKTEAAAEADAVADEDAVAVDEKAVADEDAVALQIKNDEIFAKNLATIEKQIDQTVNKRRAVQLSIHNEAKKKFTQMDNNLRRTLKVALERKPEDLRHELTRLYNAKREQLQVDLLAAVVKMAENKFLMEEGGKIGGGGTKPRFQAGGGIEPATDPHVRLKRELQNIPLDFKRKIEQDFPDQNAKNQEEKYYLAFYILNYL